MWLFSSQDLPVAGDNVNKPLPTSVDVTRSQETLLTSPPAVAADVLEQLSHELTGRSDPPKYSSDSVNSKSLDEQQPVRIYFYGDCYCQYPSVQEKTVKKRKSKRQAESVGKWNV